MLGLDVICMRIHFFFFIYITFHIVNLLIWPAPGTGKLYKHPQVMKVVCHLLVKSSLGAFPGTELERKHLLKSSCPVGQRLPGLFGLPEGAWLVGLVSGCAFLKVLT